jgi:chromosomal replication initiation ATPase DnaA
LKRLYKPIIMNDQLIFPLSDAVAVDYRAGSLAPLHCQAKATQWLAHDQDWPGGGLLLVGAAGSGKTHLAHAWLEQASNHWGRGFFDASAWHNQSVEAYLADLPPQPVVVVLDNADHLTADAESTALHLYHAIQRRQGRLLLTACQPPNPQLPDLASRLRAIATAHIEQPDDQDLRQVLTKWFRDRQLQPDAGLPDYLLARVERSFASLQQLVARLDEQSLRRQSPITLPFARQVAEQLAEEQTTDA